MKKGRLNQTELEFIQKNKNMPAEKIAETLDRSVKVIQNTLNTMKEEETKKKTKKPWVDPSFGGSGIKTKNNVPVARVMTPGHSELESKGSKKYDNSYMHKPLG